MFGYVKPRMPELKVKELDAYKAVYCGLCGQLGRSFGPAARLTLSYDFTFLAMLHWSVTDEKPCVRRRRCYFNPLKRLPVCTGGEPLSLGADVAAIMLYYKLLDNIQDSGFPGKIGWGALRPFAGHAWKKAVASRPECEALVAGSVARQRELELALTPSVDEACEPTAAALGGIFRRLSGDADTRRVLERLGYLVGRYIYLCDALDDMEEDALTGGYNPYVLRFGLKDAGEVAWRQAREEAAASLNMTIGEAERTLALLTLGDFAPILENIVTMGLRGSVDEILSKKEQIR